MNRSLMKQLFSIFVFLLLGCVKLSASTATNFEVVVSITADALKEYEAPQALLIHQDFIFTSVHVTLEKESQSVFTTDNEKAEEETPTSVKKGASIPALYPAIHFTTQFVATCDTPKKRFHSRNYFVYIPSNTIQILFCTFRI